MQSMMNYKFADVILVPFPFTNQRSLKKRPAVIVSSDDYNQAKLDLIIMAITSQITVPLSLGEVQIIDFSAAGLLKPSLIKPVIATVEIRLVIRKLGKLQSRDKKSLQQMLTVVLGN